MSNIREFLIPFSGLKIGKHEFDYKLDISFFEYFDYRDFEVADILSTVILDKKETFLELFFTHKGTVRIPCDRTGDMFDLPISGQMNLLVKFGDTYNDDHDELLIIPYSEYQINIAQYLYELVVLSVPSKRVSPGNEIDDNDWEYYESDEDID